MEADDDRVRSAAQVLTEFRRELIADLFWR